MRLLVTSPFSFRISYSRSESRTKFYFQSNGEGMAVTFVVGCDLISVSYEAKYLIFVPCFLYILLYYLVCVR
jgi:hypothetical protein